MIDGRLHHVGYVVSSIEKDAPGFQTALNARWDGVVIHDPIQRVRVSFLSTPNPNDALIELVEPAEPQSPVTQFLEKGGGLHHLCYEVPNLQQLLEQARARKLIVVRKPQPAVAFGGRLIAWVITPQKLLVEYLESGS